MSAALVESVRAAVALDGRTNMAAWTAEYDARRALDLPAILAALTEAEALRAQVAAGQAREVALREGLLDALADMPSVDCEKCTDVHVVRVHGEPDDYDCGGEGCIECGYADKLARLEKLSVAPTDTAALRAFGERCVVETLRYMQDNWDDFSAEEWLAAMCNPNHTDSGIIVDRVLGGS